MHLNVLFFLCSQCLCGEIFLFPIMFFYYTLLQKSVRTRRS